MNEVNNLINDFSLEQLRHFFRSKLGKFKPITKNYNFLFEDKEKILSRFTNIMKLGEAEIKDYNNLLIITTKSLAHLTHRSGKKIQYEIAKKILKEEDKDAAFFIFYDDKNDFRFSFIKANYLGTKRDFTSFKRYTYFVSKDQTNKTFIKQIGETDFTDLDRIQDAFSVEPLTKLFYKKLQHWYFWAIDNSKFPDDAENEENGREIALIRLITRLMFIWFMKVRDLIPDELFQKEFIEKILADTSPQSSTYYKAILQNLFFATLNTKREDRKFRSEKRNKTGYNPDFGNHNVFRYHDLFKNEEKLIKSFENIPFLNGGLFECLDIKSNKKEDRKYIDGFTAIKSQQPIVPNFLFFSDTQKKDISKYYGKKNKEYEVEGLINLLQSYNFTIDENTPGDIEVALDPELLGSVFENLLASYNPETSTTARKATGSFYTPREIVNYMTNESLKKYFLTHLEETDDLEDKLDKLIKANDSKNPFPTNNSQEITKLIDNLRVVDPAVGSGAFPMAVLNKLVFILSKVDPDNEFWKRSQIEGIKRAVSDPPIQRKLIEHTERQFRHKNADYGRKLYLIEKCIYGVDIQLIAVEIAKLRFFISLLVDEEIVWNEPENNYGIEPLPNLDFKLMQGNSLISSFAGFDFDNYEKEKDDLFAKNEFYHHLIKQFEELKNEYQNVFLKEEKDELREKIEKLIIEIFEAKISESIPELKKIRENAEMLPTEKKKNKYISLEKKKLNKKLGYDIEKKEKELKNYTKKRKHKDFFLWNIYFAEVFSEKGGFDIVIGNPPYGIGVLSNYEKNNLKNYKVSGCGEVCGYFVEKEIGLLKHMGIFVNILAGSIVVNRSTYIVRKLMRGNGSFYLSFFGTRPARLFPGNEKRVSITIGQKGISEPIKTSRNFRFSEEQRTELFKDIKFTSTEGLLLNNKIGNENFNEISRLPKIGSNINREILKKLKNFVNKNRIIKDCLTDTGNLRLYYRKSGGYWLAAMENFPYKSTKVDALYFTNEVSRNFVKLIINSSLFYLFWCIYGNNRDLTKKMITSFPVPNLGKLENYRNLIKNKSLKLEKSLENVFDADKGRVGEFSPSKIKSFLDKIDLLLGKFYNLTTLEIDHIINYDSQIRS